MAELAQRLGGDIEIGEALNGYSQGFHIVRDGEVLLRCLTRGAGSAADTSQFLAASTASEVYPIFQELYPKHSVSRLMPVRTIRAQVPGTSSRHWLRRSARFTRSLWPHSAKAMSARTVRGRHQGPLLVLREQKFAVQDCHLRKGLEQIAKGIPDDPTRVRLEVRIRPVPSPKSSSVLQD